MFVRKLQTACMFIVLRTASHTLILLNMCCGQGTNTWNIYEVDEIFISCQYEGFADGSVSFQISAPPENIDVDGQYPYAALRYFAALKF